MLQDDMIMLQVNMILSGMLYVIYITYVAMI